MRFRSPMVAALVSSLIMPALPALATQEPETSASIIETVSVNAGIDGTADDLLDDLDAMAKKDFDGTTHLELGDASRVEINLDASMPANVTTNGETVGITPVLEPESEDEWTEEETGLSTVRGGEEFETVRALKSDGTVQFATIVENAAAPERFEYELDLPEGSKVEEVGEAILIISNDEELLGGFMPPWAKDANGRDIPTSYELADGKLVQTVNHRSIRGLEYPLLADPAYVNGMIKRVNHERWRNGGWEVQIEATALARYTWFFNPSLVAGLGYKDLLEHHPRSMKKATMKQQWDCHATGLIGTFKIDLEGYRTSKPSWRKTEIMTGLKNAIKKKNVAAVSKACNW